MSGREKQLCHQFMQVTVFDQLLCVILQLFFISVLVPCWREWVVEMAIPCALPHVSILSVLPMVFEFPVHMFRLHSHLAVECGTVTRSGEGI